MFDHVLRLLKDRWFAPLARALGPAVPPNLISLVALVVGLGSAVAVARGADALALALWIANRLLDGLDGSVARVHHGHRDFGGYLDILLDFVVYAAIPVGMVLATPAREQAVAGVVLLASFFVNAASWMYLAAVLERRSSGATARGELTTVTMPPGVIAGTETFAFYAAFLLLPQWRVPGFAVMAALVGVTVAQRLWWGWRHLR